jgi:tRNA G10  N-methylase Trm11
VLPDVGERPWSHSIGTAAAAAAVASVRLLSPSTQTIVVPCCGLGTILAAANEQGYAAVGIERNRKRALAARTFGLDG